MKIRNGHYTIYNGIELAFFSIRYENYLPKEKILYSICYSIDSNLHLEGFNKHPFKEEFCKNILLSDLSNLYYIKTFGLYKGILVDVFEFKPASRIFHIYTSDKSSVDKYSFLDMANGKYGKDVNISELEKLWEERKPSQFNLPMPEGLELYKELPIPKI